MTMPAVAVLLLLGACSVLLTTVVHGDVHYHDFFLRETNFTRLCLNKTMMTVNDSFPGPAIRVHRGDTLYVNVHNQGDFGVTIHWHGVKQPRNPWSDGPAYITQCPIEPGMNFTYEVIFSREIGTLWWHAHSDWTRSSVHGAIVILPAEGTTYPFPEPDGDEVVVLSSWYEEDINEVVAADLAMGEETPWSDAYTINGQPGDFCACSNESTYRWSVDYGKTYLIRLVNAVMNVEMFFEIGQHNLTVVGMDGSYIKPIVTSYVMLSPGQTMDILVTTNQTSGGQYYMVARQFDSVRAGVSDYDKVNATAILQYDGNYTDTSDPYFPADMPMYENFAAAIDFTSRIRSLANKDYPIDVPKNITTRMYIIVSMNDIQNGSNGRALLASSLNNVSWTNPSMDVLMAYYRNLSGIYTDDFPDWPLNFYNFTADNPPEDTEYTFPGTKVKVLNYDEEVEVVFQGTNVLDASEDHPMHMHGYAFYVIGSGYGNFNNDTDPQNYNLIDPPELNTVSVPKMGWVAIRFRASNPGVWLWHCHFDRHLSWGMDTAFIVKNGGTPETSIREPPPYMPACNASALQVWKADYSSDGLERSDTM